MNSTQNATCNLSITFDPTPPQHAVIIGIVYTVIFYTGVFVSSIMYYRRRKYWPLSNYKHHWLYGVSVVGYFIGGCILSFREMVGRANLPCDIYIFAQIFFLPSVAIPVIIKLFILHNSLYFQNHVAGSQHKAMIQPLLDGASLTKKDSDLSTALRRMKALSFRKSSSFALILGTISFLFLMGLTSFSMASNENAFKGCKGCSLSKNELGVFGFLVGLTFVVTYLLIYISRNDKDATGEVANIRRFIFVSTIAYTVWISLELIFEEISNAQTFHWAYVWGVFVFGPHQWYMVVKPILKTYETTNRRPKRLKDLSPDVVQSSVRRLTFDDILKDSVASAAFEKYLISEYSIEHLEFYNQTSKWKEAYDDASFEQRCDNAYDLYEYYIKNGALLEINVDWKRRKECVNIIKISKAERNKPYDEIDFEKANVPKTAFDGLMEAVFRLLKLDSYPRFITSPSFDKLMDDFESSDYGGSMSE